MQLMLRRFSSLTVLSIGTLLPGLASGRDGPSRYAVTKLGSLGGTSSSGNSLNDLGLAAGTSNLPGDTTQHATAWLGSLLFDLRRHRSAIAGLL